METLDSLPHGVLSIVLSHCGPLACERFGTLNKTFCQASRAPSLWQVWSQRDFFVPGEGQPTGPGGQQYGSWRELYSDWTARLAGRSWAPCRVALLFWRDVKLWASSHFPLLLDTLNPGLPVHELETYEAWFGYRLPDELAALYLVHNGQRDIRPGAGFLARTSSAFTQASQMPDMLSRAKPRDFAALFGHCSFYDHYAVSFLLPLEAAVAQSAFNRRSMPPAERTPVPPAVRAAVPMHGMPHGVLPGHLLITCSPEPFGRKVVCVSCLTGAVGVFSRDHTCLSAVGPGHVIVAEGASEVTAWLQTYAHRLTTGVYQVKPVHHEYSPDSDPDGCALSLPDLGNQLVAIDLFPSAPLLKTCTTHGICVSVSTIMVPEVSLSNKIMFTYQVTFGHATLSNERLAPDAVSDARLLSREWNTYDLDGQQTGHVEGEGVIGLHPHVYPGCPEVPYRSCTYIAQCGESMEGTFRFATSGERVVEVQCPSMQFTYPDCLY